jgi:LAO/AO transport system kinase
LIQEWNSRQKKIAVICIDPSSPFHHGALLGDRIRMNRWYDHPSVFIRSLASRGALGGLHPKIIEITDVLKAAPFDLILLETVGVGQSEIEIAGLADVTAVVLVPESGDEIQTLKAGLYEIASLFIVNKSDRPGAELFTKNLIASLASWGRPGSERVPVLQTIALQHQGISEVIRAIEKVWNEKNNLDEKAWVLAQKAYYLIQEKRMKDISKTQLKEKIRVQLEKGPLNLYAFCQNFS